MTSRAPNTPRFRERKSRRELVTGALVVAMFAVVFLWTPIARTDAALVPAQLGQRSTLTHVAPTAGDAGGNAAGGVAAADVAAAELVSDVWSRYVPWALFSRAPIRAGRLPLWNDLSGPGAPHFANVDTAVLSPFTLPWYVLDVRAAALLSAFARLFALGFFTFLFLSEMRVAFAAAIVGAVAYQFAGVNVIGLFAPAAAAAVLAPAGLFVVERMARATERAIALPDSAARLRPGWGLAAALAAVVAVAFLSGGFATFLFTLLLVAAYATARFFRISAREPDSAASLREVRLASVRMIGAFAVAGCIAAVQFLPWIERMDHVAPAATLAAALEPLPTDSLLLDVFPDLLGSPTGPFQLDAALRPDRHAVLGEHVGSLALFLALLGAFFARRRRAAVFFASTAIAWFAAAHGLLSRTFLAVWPGGSIAPVQQGQVVFAFSIAVLAALALDRVVTARRAADARIAFAVVVLGACSLWALRSSADTLASETLARVPEAQHVFAQMSSSAHVEAISAVFCAGLLCVALALVVRPGRARSWLVLGAGVAVFAETGWITSDVHPLAPRSMVYPRTSDMEQLVELARGKPVLARGNEVLVLGRDRIEPDTHLAYGLRQLTATDLGRTQRCDRLLRGQFGVDGDVITRASERALRLFGVGIVLEKNRFPAAQLGSGEAPAPGMSFASAEILVDTPFVQRFVDVRGRSGPLSFEWVTTGWRNECMFRVALFDAQSGQRIFRAVYAPGDLRPRGQSRMPCAIDVPDAERRPGRKLVLKISSDDAVAGHSWSVLCRSASNVEASDLTHDPADWIATQGPDPLPGRLALQPDDDPTSLQLEAQIGSFAARTCMDAARYRTVPRAYATEGAEDAWNTMLRPGFDPRAIVVLEDVDKEQTIAPGGPDESDRVEVLQECDGFVRLHTHRARAGWLVADIAWYPGWRARVDGAPVPLHCANYAFTALALPAGERTVELEFAPDSVRTGAAISCVGLLLLSCMMGAAIASARSRG